MNSGKPLNQSLAIAYSMKKKAKKMAEGGMIKADESCDHDEDIVERIMKNRHGYSKGGMIANNEHGENDNDLADFSPAEFDDLVLRDDLEFNYDGENSGDYLGNKQEDEDREDIISRIMRSRKLKDHNPRPA